MPIPGAQQHKRPRRRYEEIERMYKCGWNGCEKAYGTLNHLNAHVTMQSHGQKRTPEGMLRMSHPCLLNFSSLALRCILRLKPFIFVCFPLYCFCFTFAFLLYFIFLSKCYSSSLLLWRFWVQSSKFGHVNQHEPLRKRQL